MLYVGDTLDCIRFYSRLRVPRLAGSPPPCFVRMVRALPLAGALLGLPQALVSAGALAVGLNATISALLGVAVMAMMTGALHEDGIADTVDGFWGGRTPERRLEIMRDSRIGVFGATALFLILALRVATLAALAQKLPLWEMTVVLMLTAALSRTVGLLTLVRLPPARRDGIAAAVGRPSPKTFLLALVTLVIGAALAFWVLKMPLTGLFDALLLALLAVAAITRMADRMIGGQTGDVAGASQQMADITTLLALTASL